MTGLAPALADVVRPVVDPALAFVADRPYLAAAVLFGAWAVYEGVDEVFDDDRRGSLVELEDLALVVGAAVAGWFVGRRWGPDLWAVVKALPTEVPL